MFKIDRDFQKITHKDVRNFDNEVLAILGKLWTRYGIKTKVISELVLFFIENINFFHFTRTWLLVIWMLLNPLKRN